MFIRYLYRILLLKSNGWYKNMNGGYCDSHHMVILSKWQIFIINNRWFRDLTSIYKNKGE